MSVATTITVSLDLVPLNCYSCGVWFAIPADLQRSRTRNGKSFWCPNGHAQVFRGGEVEQLKERLAAARDAARLEANRAEGLERERLRLANDLMDQAKEHKRVLRRANAGVCQHCRRHFENVDRHVAKVHPAERAGVR